MAIQKSSDCKLKIGNGGSPEVFSVVGGVTVNEFELNNKIYESTNLNSGSWRKLVDGAGVKELSISVSGTFSDSAAEQAIRLKAFVNQKARYQLLFANGNVIEADFMIRSYNYSAKYELEQKFEIRLESAGDVSLV